MKKVVMRDLKINPANLPYIFSGISLFVSITFMIVAIAIGYPTIKTKTNSDMHTTATRVEINSHRSSDGHMMYSPVFFYNVNGKEYSCSTGSSSDLKPNIDNNKIYYKSQNPDFCISEYDFIRTCIFVGIFFIIAFLLFIIGLYVLVYTIIGNTKYKNLIKHGQLIKNIPCRILPSNVTLNDKQGYIIELEYQELKLKSGIKFDIDTSRNTADLLIDPLNPKNYFIGFDITQS